MPKIYVLGQVTTARVRRLRVICSVLLLITSLITTAVAQKPRPTLPRVFINTTWGPPSGGMTWAAHTSSELSSALSSAAPGDIIVLDAGTIYMGNFTLPAKSNPNKKWIYIETSAYTNLPSPGKRVSPADAVNMPKIVTPGAANAIRLHDGANYWRFVGVEIYSASTYHPSGYTPGVYYGYALVDKFSYPGTSHIPDHIFFDRCYLHGDATHDLQEGISGNFSYFAVVDSYISEIHMKLTDTQAIVSYITPGPIKVTNSFLEGAGENFMLGGSGGGAFGYVPSDVEFQYNYVYKPLSWVPPSLNGTYRVKNLWECKSCRYVLVNQNTFENNWVAAQSGAAFLLTVRTSDSGDIAVVEDITVTNNYFKNVVRGIDTASADSSCGTPSYPNCHNAGVTDRWDFTNNLVTLWDNTKQGGTGAQHIGLIVLSDGLNIPGGNVIVPTRDVVLQHNTVVPFPNQPCWQSIYFYPSYQPPYNNPPPWSQPPTLNVWIQDNVLCKQPSGAWSPTGMNLLNDYMALPNTPPYDVTKRYYGNVMDESVNHAYTWPTGNTVATSGITYVNPPTDYTLLSPNWTNTYGPPTPPYLSGVIMSLLGQ